ncbi:M48 family metallopeptidase [Ideonella sp. B508-1]|uniref:tetratricopeptide repeat protein n=1 Tax=Ideonella sp. B508-1 TaxID=137716 RepID=UPI00034D1274|nr:hypothetical protein [Ideonella sp. B508-1]
MKPATRISPRHASLALGAIVCALLTACATPNTPAPTAAPVAPTLESYLAQASQAQADGQREKARGFYRDAAKAYPTDKTPWLKLAEDYFAAGDYGNAVLAGQEALERDPQDNTANSLLAVSGLRITAGSLKALRKDAEYPVGSREEALAVTRSLRETLGETALLPIVPPGSEPPKPKVVPKRRPATAPAATAAPAAPHPAPAATAGGNPLDKLK